MTILKICIVAVTWNKKKDICLLIADIEQLKLDFIALDVFVVDNASSDGTQDLIQNNHPNVKLLQTQVNLGGSGGFSYGLNFVKNLEYDYIWLLDNDVRLDSNALVNLAQTLRDNPKVGLVGSQIRKSENPPIIHELGISICTRKAHLKNIFSNFHVDSLMKMFGDGSYIEADICSAASLLVRREIVNQIGVFEDYFLHFDDVEWCLRAKKESWIIAANPNSVVWHPSPESKQRPWIIYYDERNLCYCWLKHRPELLLKRVRVLIPRLLFYTITGRYFLVKIYFQAFNDFLSSVKGKMKSPLPFLEYQLEEIVTKDSVILIDSDICKQINQIDKFKELEAKHALVFWRSPKKFASLLFTYLVSYFWKPSDLGIFSIHKPKLHRLTLVKRAYYFTGTGYVIADMRLSELFINLFKVCCTMARIYWKIWITVYTRHKIN